MAETKNEAPVMNADMLMPDVRLHAYVRDGKVEFTLVTKTTKAHVSPEEAQTLLMMRSTFRAGS